jgi:hypothetical protein
MTIHPNPRQIGRRTRAAERRDVVCVAGLCIVLLLLPATHTLADVRKVPSDYPTIQAGIDASADGDIVLVASGTYTGDGNRDIEFRGKAITVRSEAGPETCIIDCQGSEAENHRGVCFRPESHPVNICFDGFTVKNGFISKEKYPESYPHGGGIFCLGGSPTIRNCIITNNHALGGGGGLWCSGDMNLSPSTRPKLEIS